MADAPGQRQVVRIGEGTATVTMEDWAPADLQARIAEIAAWVPARQKRLWRAILNDLQALSPTQQANIKKDLLAGTPPKWTTMTDDPTVWAILGNPSAATTLQLVAAVVELVLTNPTYLVNPAFDPTINVPGDQAVS